MNTSKGSEKINGDGAAAEINVETVDYRRPAAGANEDPHPEKVTVTHLLHDDHKRGSAATSAAAEVAEKLQSFNEAVGDTLSRMQ